MAVGYQFRDLMIGTRQGLLSRDLSLPHLTQDELAILLSEEVEKEPTAQELRLLVPGYKERILAGVLARMESANRQVDPTRIPEAAQA